MSNGSLMHNGNHANLGQRSLGFARALTYHLKTIWLFTVSDHLTFVLPQSLFGLIGALSGPALTTNPSPAFPDAFASLPLVVIWTWLNTFVFVLSNQGSSDAIKEDSLNKPWRPLPAGRITLAQARLLLLFTIPAVLLATYFYLGAFQETAVLFSLTWMYNDVHGADDNFVIRNLIITVAYVFYGSGALRVAAAFSQNEPSRNANSWLAITAGVILSTMSIQDLKDQEGDRARARRTAPIVLGEKCTRYLIALAVSAWSCLCPMFWHVNFGTFVACVAMGLLVAVRLIVLRGRDVDRVSWKLWSIWLMGLYCLPSFAESSTKVGKASHI